MSVISPKQLMDTYIYIYAHICVYLHLYTTPRLVALCFPPKPTMGAYRNDIYQVFRSHDQTTRQMLLLGHTLCLGILVCAIDLNHVITPKRHWLSTCHTKSRWLASSWFRRRGGTQGAYGTRIYNAQVNAENMPDKAHHLPHPC